MYGEVGAISMNNQMNNTSVNTGQVNNASINPSLGNSTANNAGMNTNSTNPATSNARKVLPKAVEKNPKYTENWINIKKVSNGIIYNDTNEMVTGVKIRPKNIFILDRSSMDNTLVGLMNFYNTLDYEFWLIIADRPVDITMYEAELQLLYNRTQDPVIRKIINQDIEKGDYFTNNNVVDTEYYILFKEKNMDLLQKKIRNMINGLAGAGLIASQTSNDDLYMVLDNFFNAGRNYETGTVMPL